MPCLFCPNERVFARGMCQACYYRERRNGSVARKNVRNTGVCSVEGCGKPALAKNLCQKHYKHSRGYEYGTWITVRSRNPGDYPVAWATFEGFLADVGERPGPNHKLKRRDGNLPYSKDNVIWQAPVGASHASPIRRDDPDYDRAWTLNRKYGMTIEEAEALLAAQGGVCAGCQRDRRHLHHLSGKPCSMHVDHDHVTSDVRGILCSSCNRASGLVGDDPDTLRRLADYLERARNKGGQNAVLNAAD